MVKDKSFEVILYDVYKYLPKYDCGEKSPCGEKRCKTFAEKLLFGEKKVFGCPYLKEKDEEELSVLLSDYFNL